MLVHPQFDPIAFKLFGPLAVRWYGLTYLLGFALVWLVGRYAIKTRAQSALSAQDFDDLLFYGILGVILGGRLGYVLFYKFGDYVVEPWKIFFVWEGGMSFHGGMLGVIVAMWWYARARRVDWLAITDFIAPLVPLGLGAGRLGNFINAELWGRASDVPWAMVFPNVDRIPRHPSQLYEFALEGVVLFVATLVVCRETAAARCRVGVFSDRLRGVSLCGGIHARTRQLSRPACARLVARPVAVAADDYRGRSDAGMGIPAPD